MTSEIFLGEKRVLCFGDSNTFGYDPRSYLGSQYPPEVRWTGRLEAAGWRVLNAGQNGRCVPGPKEFPAVSALLRRSQPLEAVTVMLGSNDLLQEPSLSPRELAGRMERFLEGIREAANPARLLLIAPPPMRPGTWVQDRETLERSAQLGPCYARLAQALGISFADAGAWSIPLAFDGVHFLPEGHAAFARGLLPLLELSPENNTPEVRADEHSDLRHEEVL